MTFHGLAGSPCNSLATGRQLPKVPQHGLVDRSLAMDRAVQRHAQITQRLDVIAVVHCPLKLI